MKKYMFVLSAVSFALGFAGIQATVDGSKDVKAMSTQVDEKVPVGMKKCMVGDKTTFVAVDAACPADVKAKDNVNITPKPVDVKDSKDFKFDLKKDEAGLKSDDMSNFDK